MTRSIHTTHRDLARLRRSSYADATRRRHQIERARDQLAEKRAVKERVREARDRLRAGASPATGLGPDVETLPIAVRDEGPYVHYPAGVDDVRAILRLLSPGMLDGLTGVSLCLGREVQLDWAGREQDDYAPDPYTGRVGYENLPGVFSGSVYGTYHPDRATIQIYAFVYDPDLHDRAMRELYLRLHMLNTLVHEVEHHCEVRARGGRGRWLARLGGDQSEEYVRRRAYAWTERIIADYLRRTYPEELGALGAWVAEHGGAMVPLPRLVDGSLRYFFNVTSAFETLMTGTTNGRTTRDVRLEYAQDLCFAECYDEALRCVELLISEDAQDVDALVLRAEIFEHAQRFTEAETTAQEALGVLAERATRKLNGDASPETGMSDGSAPERDMDDAARDAWRILVDVYQARGRWREMAVAASEVILLSEGGRHWAIGAHFDRARARIELGDFVGTRVDIEAIGEPQGRRRARPDTLMLRALLALREGHYADAWRLAVRGFANPREMAWRPEFMAVRFEAAHHLGRPERAGRLTRRAVERLRERGYGAWMDRLEGTGRANMASGNWPSIRAR